MEIISDKTEAISFDSPAKIISFNSLADLYEKFTKMFTDKNCKDYNILPALSPETAENGVYIFSNSDSNEEYCFRWPMFDRKFETEIIKTTNPIEYIEFAEKENVKLCDYPKTLEYGIVSYDEENHKATILKIKIRDIKEYLAKNDDNMFEKINKIRKFLYKEDEQRKEILCDIAKCFKNNSEISPIC